MEKHPPSPHPLRSGYRPRQHNNNNRQQQRKPYNAAFCTISHGRHTELHFPHRGPTWTYQWITRKAAKWNATHSEEKTLKSVIEADPPVRYATQKYTAKSANIQN